jgi:hypothetical protein
VRDLRRVHSHIAALGYLVLERASESDDNDREAARAVPVPLASNNADQL